MQVNRNCNDWLQVLPKSRLARITNLSLTRDEGEDFNHITQWLSDIRTFGEPCQRH